MVPLEEPFSTYQRRLQTLRDAATKLDLRDLGFSRARVVCFFLTGGAALVAWTRPGVSPAWAMGLAGVFVLLVIGHQKLIQARDDVLRRIDCYQRGLQRCGCQIPVGSPTGNAGDASHPYAADLDIFGENGMFGLLSTAQTSMGEHTLCRWLLHPASRDEILMRQRVARELCPFVDLREDVACLSAPVRKDLHPESLLRWASAPSALPKGVYWLIWLCNALLAAALTAWLTGKTGTWPLLAVIGVQALVGKVLQNRVETVMAALEQPSRELPLLARLIARIRRETFKDPYLAKLHGALGEGSKSASVDIARLDFLTNLYDLQKNQLFSLIAWLLLWAPHCAYQVETWRRHHGGQVPSWLNAIGELEALLSLGNYSFEHPADVFAQIENQGPFFYGENLAHPLLPPDQAVPNTVLLDQSKPCLMVSGSNMSGKSTLLRTVGINAVLALAGAPVRAKMLTLSVMNVGATLRVQDSLQAGTSRFYAEVQRLHQLLELTQANTPLLFLLDEILHGTNSHDRAVGAFAIIKSFLARGAIGLVTTHDLALTAQAEKFSGRNVHFVDDMIDGKLHFDYRMHAGVVKKSNALALLRAAGLYQ